MIKLIGVYPSTQKNKKLVALFDIDGNLKMVHFGSKNLSSYLDHKDEEKRDNYIRKQIALGTEDLNDPLTPASLIMYLLYGNYADLRMNIKQFKKTFKI
jgi:hypothetical protein